MQKRPTSRDVARLAGVSQSTVSFVYTGREGVAPATRDRVLQAAAELNYRPNLAARAMRTQRTGRLAVVFPVSSPNPLTMLRGATVAAEDAGYVLEILSLPDDREARAERVEELIDGGQYEGFLSFTPLPQRIQNLSHDRGPIVLCASTFDDEAHATGIFTDARPIAAMIERLAELGHRRFLHITGPLDFPSAVARRDAYLATVERLGLQSLGVFPGDWTSETGVEIVASLPDNVTPFALIAPNDNVAIGAMRAARLRGWSMPGDMSITGWDDIGTSAFLVPSLTSVVQERGLVGEYAMHRLIAAVRGEEEPEPLTEIHRIVWRESTGAPAA